jgi:hypothetical protein
MTKAGRTEGAIFNGIEFMGTEGFTVGGNVLGSVGNKEGTFLSSLFFHT